MTESLCNFLMKLPRANLINLMLESLDNMQHYNGQSRMRVILEVLGAKEIEEGRWERPSLVKAKEATSSTILLD